MPKPSRETLEKNRDNYTSQVKNIISYIKGSTSDNKDPFGFVMIPFYRTIEQAERNDWKKLCGGVVSNINETSLMKTALCDALEAYAKSDRCKTDKQLSQFDKDDRPTALAVELAMALGEDTKNFDEILLMHLGELKYRNGKGLIYASLPNDINKSVKENNGELNIGRCPLYISYKLEDFTHAMAALIVGYCKRHGYEIEDTANKVFGLTMSANCEISDYPTGEDD